MAAKKPQEAEAEEAKTQKVTPDYSDLLQEHAPWLLGPDLGVCVVGSTALGTACMRAGIAGPESADLDLSWDVEVERGTALLEEHGVFIKTTEANRQRGTLALKLANFRIEITSLRHSPGAEPTDDLRERILTDLAGRDMTVGALAHWLAEDQILDPFDGLEHWRERRIVPVGDPGERIEEHPVRWLRYYRRAHEWGFTLDNSIRKVSLDRAILKRVPDEALAAELRSALLNCTSPGRFLLELAECSVLQVIAPELALQFDGRPAGPVRHHPEVSQALHLILALEWIVEHTANLQERDRNMAIVAVLCHDLGKGYTPHERLPSHHGHENAGIEPLRDFLDRFPGLTDPTGKCLAEAVCELHLQIRTLNKLRAGSLAKLYDRYLRDKNFRVHLFALAIGADSGGRLDRQAEGDAVAERVEADILWIQRQCAQVDAAALWETHKGDRDRFKLELLQAWARLLSDCRKPERSRS